jgi:hypothetical protein
MMCATAISESITQVARFSWRRMVCIMVLLTGSHELVAAEIGQPETVSVPAITNLAEHFHQVFQDARAKFLADQSNATNAWQFGRACFDLAEIATNGPVKAEIAEQGIAACRRAIALRPVAPAHYYLGMTIGQLADTKRNLSALKMVKEMEREFLAARELDQHYDFAGPDRNLGLLYLQAPAMISIGSRSKARHHLKLAVQLAPDFPENRLNLIESMLKAGDEESAQHELKALEKLWPSAKTTFIGPLWAPSLVDWQKRMDEAKKKIAAASK